MRAWPALSVAAALGVSFVSCRAAPEGDREVPARPSEIPPAASAYLVDTYGEQKFQSEIRPWLLSPDAPQAVRWIENHLLGTKSLTSIRNLAFALGWLGRRESRRALLKKLGGARGGPKYGGVIFGGDSDQAHYALIWAVARLEGRTFEDFNDLIEWWSAYPPLPRDNSP